MATMVKLKMKLGAPKKHSVLFKPDEHVVNPAITGLYLMKHTYEGLGTPEEIEVTIEAVK